MEKPIIDVSAHNGTIDWAKVKGNVQAAIIRLGYTGYGSGTVVYDAKYRANRAGCEANGIPFTLYFFPSSVTDAEARAEARFIIDACQGMSFPLPVFLDSEYTEPNGRGRADQLDRATRTRLLRIICEELQAKEIPAGVYSSTSWLKNRLDVDQLPFHIWVAHWASVLGWAGAYSLWQYSSSGSIPGISGRVDLSRPAPGFRIPMDAACRSVDELAQEVIAGKWGNGADRKARLTAAGYNYDAVQTRVNELLRKSVDELAREVIAGKWGNGADRRARLTAAGYNYDAVQTRVNELLK